MSLRKNIISLLTGATIAATSFVTGCGEKTFKTEFKNEIQTNYNVTEDQSDVAYVSAERGRYMNKNKDGTYTPNFKTVDLEKQIERVQYMKDGLESTLNTNPPHEWTKYMDENPGMRQLFLKREKVIDFHLRQLKAKKCYMEFQQLMGYAASGSQTVINANKYDLSDFFPDLTFGDKFRLGRRDVDEAKVKQELQRFEMQQKFERDIPNPEFPFKDRIKQTIKQQINEGFVIIGYDINQPVDHEVDYIEMYRKTKDGKLETLPAIRVYKSLSSDQPNIAVVDNDRQGERGYGLPDSVVRISGLEKATELYARNAKLVYSVFSDPFKLKRTRLIETDRDIEIVPVGSSLEQKLWVVSADGYDVPVTYKNEKSDNYRLDKSKGLDLKDKKLEEWVFSKNFNDPNRVIEMYRLKEEFRNLKISYVDIRNRYDFVPDATGTDMFKTRLEIILELQNGDTKTGSPDQMLEAMPTSITYDYGAKYRDTILDADGKDKPKYELRMRQARPLTLKEASSAHKLVSK